MARRTRKVGKKRKPSVVGRRLIKMLKSAEGRELTPAEFRLFGKYRPKGFKSRKTRRRSKGGFVGR